MSQITFIFHQYEFVGDLFSMIVGEFLAHQDDQGVGWFPINLTSPESR
jgi:hypothetical protein